jgi:hypothetical protein
VSFALFGSAANTSAYSGKNVARRSSSPRISPLSIAMPIRIDVTLFVADVISTGDARRIACSRRSPSVRGKYSSTTNRPCRAMMTLRTSRYTPPRIRSSIASMRVRSRFSSAGETDSHPSAVFAGFVDGRVCCPQTTVAVRRSISTTRSGIAPDTLFMHDLQPCQMRMMRSFFQEFRGRHSPLGDRPHTPHQMMRASRSY